MNVGLLIPSHNAVTHFDRMVMSLHNQTHAEWKGYVGDIASKDRLEEITWAMNHTWDCAILREKFEYHQLASSAGFPKVIDSMLASSDYHHCVAMISPTYRFSYRALEVVSGSFSRDIEWVKIGLAKYSNKHKIVVPVYFLKRSIFDKVSMVIRDDGLFSVNIDESEINGRTISTTMGYDFS